MLSIFTSIMHMLSSHLLSPAETVVEFMKMVVRLKLIDKFKEDPS